MLRPLRINPAHGYFPATRLLHHRSWEKAIWIPARKIPLPGPSSEQEKPGVYTVPERRASVRKRPSNPSQHGRSNSPAGILFPQGKSESPRQPALMACLPFLQVVHQNLFQSFPGFRTAPVALLHGEILSYKTILNVPLLHCGIRTLLEQAAQPKGEIVQKASFRT